jgi:phosphatidylinositol alpha-mannosyltransferase
MRVGLVCPYSFDVHGGVQNHVLDLAAALVGLGHEVAVLAPGDSDSRLPAYVTTTGRTVPMPYNGSVARVSFGPLVAGRVRRWLAQGDLDLVHIHEPATPSVSVLALWAARVPVVATFHTAQERSWALATTAATFLRAGLAKIDAHVVVSDEAHRTMARYVDAEPTLIPNGVHVARFAGDRDVLPGGPRLAFVGRLDEPRKGLDVLLRAMPDILRGRPTAELVVVGEGSARALTRGLPVGVVDRIHFAGALDDGAKAGVLRAVDVLVAPNTHGESFGVVLLEAMASGAAVAASDLPAFRSVLGDGRYGALFRAGDPGDLATVVGGLVDDDVRRRQVADEARTVARGYDWGVVAPRVLDVYDRVASGSADRSADAAAG